ALITGSVYSLMGVSMAVGAALVGRRLGRWEGEPVFLWSFVIAALLFALQGLSPSIPVLAGFRFLAGFAVAALTVAGNYLVAQAARPESRGVAFGVLNGLTSLGGVAGPLLGGVMGDRLGLASPFFGGAGLFAVAAVTLRQRRNELTASQGRTSLR
ncbi:MAG: MFS transporter, partial [Methanocella sp.]